MLRDGHDMQKAPFCMQDAPFIWRLSSRALAFMAGGVKSHGINM
jgi:hypothetical protein